MYFKGGNDQSLSVKALNMSPGGAKRQYCEAQLSQRAQTATKQLYGSKYLTKHMFNGYKSTKLIKFGALNAKVEYDVIPLVNEH